MDTVTRSQAPRSPTPMSRELRMLDTKNRPAHNPLACAVTRSPWARTTWNSFLGAQNPGGEFCAPRHSFRESLDGLHKVRYLRKKIADRAVGDSPGQRTSTSAVSNGTVVSHFYSHLPRRIVTIISATVASQRQSRCSSPAWCRQAADRSTSCCSIDRLMSCFRCSLDWSCRSNCCGPSCLGQTSCWSARSTGSNRCDQTGCFHGDRCIQEPACLARSIRCGNEIHVAHHLRGDCRRFGRDLDRLHARDLGRGPCAGPDHHRGRSRDRESIRGHRSNRDRCRRRSLLRRRCRHRTSCNPHCHHRSCTHHHYRRTSCIHHCRRTSHIRSCN